MLLFGCLMVIVVNQWGSVTVRQGLWGILLFDLFAIYSGVFLTSWLTLVRDEAFARYFDPFNALVYLSLIANLFVTLHHLYNLDDATSTAAALGLGSYLGVAATGCKALILLVKKPRRVLVDKQNVDA